MKTRTIIAFFTLLSMCALGLGAAYKIEKNRRSNAAPLTVVQRTKDTRMNIIHFPRHGLSVHDMSDEKYAAEYKYIFRVAPDIDADIKKFAVVIENSTKADIIAMSVLWRFEFANRVPYKLHLQISQTDDLLTEALTQAPVLRAGGKKSFLAIRDPHDFWKLNGILELNSLTENERERLSRLNSLINDSVSYTFEVEGALFSDGTIIGGNSQKFAERTMARYNAARDLVGRFAGKTDAEILAISKEIAVVTDAELRAPFEEARDFYYNPLFIYEQSKVGLARQLVGIHDAQGFSGIAQRLAKMQRAPLIIMSRKGEDPDR